MTGAGGIPPEVKEFILSFGGFYNCKILYYNTMQLKEDNLKLEKIR